MNAKIAIIITVPHGLCENITSRQCDLRANSCADMFLDVIPRDDFIVKVFKSDILRRNLDLNRVESYNYKWRQSVRDSLEDFINRESVSKVWGIDVHSFDNGTKYFDPGTRIALLNTWKSEPEGKALYNYLDLSADSEFRGDKSLRYYHAPEVNDILRDFKAYDSAKKRVYSTLIEFNEDAKILEAKTIKAFFGHVLRFIKTAGEIKIKEKEECKLL